MSLIRFAVDPVRNPGERIEKDVISDLPDGSELGSDDIRLEFGDAIGSGDIKRV